MPDNEKKFIIDAIPLTRIPLSRQQFFSYEYSQKLPAGTLVSIPLFRRILNGIVINSRDDFHRLGNIELKKIGKVLEENFLTGKQIELAKFISDYYLSPIGVVLKFFVPKQVKSREPKPVTHSRIYKKIKLTKEQEEAVKKIATSYKLQVTGFLLFGPSSSGKTEVYIHSIKKIKNIHKDAQFLILLPEIMLMPQALERYGAHFKPEEITVLHSKITKGEFYGNWQKIKSGKAKIIIGTRIAVFAPYKNLKLIVIDEEQDVSFKQWDMNPRYDARKVAQILAQMHQAKIVLGSATPTIETYYSAKKGEYGLIKLPKLDIPNAKFLTPGATAEIVDMKKERWVKNYSPISKILRSEIESALKNKSQTILFINRQGVSAFSVCEKCKNVLRCPRCDRALVYNASGTYKCLHCNYETEIFATCPKCKGMVFRNVGIGTQKIEKEIIKSFPGAAVKRVDSQTMKKPEEQKRVYENFSRGKIDILIGTQQITKGWDLPSVSLAGIIDADNLLEIPDFKTDERAFQNIVQVAGRVARVGKRQPGKVLIQTFNPENFVIKTAAAMDFENFYDREIDERKILKLPPFARLVKLIMRSANISRIEKESKQTSEKLSKFKSVNLKISEPQDPLISKIRGNFRKQIVLKISGNKEIPDKLGKILSKLGSEWIIDIDPISLV
jgi:primosomal protein N' (replication factor Y)